MGPTACEWAQALIHQACKVRDGGLNMPMPHLLDLELEAGYLVLHLPVIHTYILTYLLTHLLDLELEAGYLVLHLPVDLLLRLHTHHEFIRDAPMHVHVHVYACVCTRMCICSETVPGTLGLGLVSSLATHMYACVCTRTCRAHRQCRAPMHVHVHVHVHACVCTRTCRAHRQCRALSGTVREARPWSR